MTPQEPPIDVALEALTAAFVQLTGEARMDDEVRVATDTGWQVAAWVDDDTFAIDLLPAGEEPLDALDDYKLALIYGLGFGDEEEDDGGLPLFRQEFDYEPGEEWEEQALRELGLVILGLLRDVLGCSPEHIEVTFPA